MARIFSFLNPKGGVSKTTTSIGVAHALHRRGLKVALCDPDKQKSAVNWYREGVTPFDVVETPNNDAIYSIPKALKDYDIVVVDGLANDMAITAAVLMVSELVIVPVSPSPMEFATMSAMLAAIDARNNLKPIDARFLITRKKEGTKLLRQLREELKELPLQVMRTQISESENVKAATAEGLTIFDSKDSGVAKSKGEIDVLTSEILELIHG